MREREKKLSKFFHKKTSPATCVYKKSPQRFVCCVISGFFRRKYNFIFCFFRPSTLHDTFILITHTRQSIDRSNQEVATGRLVITDYHMKLSALLLSTEEEKVRTIFLCSV